MELHPKDHFASRSDAASDRRGELRPLSKTLLLFFFGKFSLLKFFSVSPFCIFDEGTTEYSEWTSFLRVGDAWLMRNECDPCMLDKFDPCMLDKETLIAHVGRLRHHPYTQCKLQFFCSFMNQSRYLLSYWVIFQSHNNKGKQNSDWKKTPKN